MRCSACSGAAPAVQPCRFFAATDITGPRAMYTLLDVVADAERRAEAALFSDRLRYRAFVEAAERFAHAHGLIVSGAAATRLLLGDPADRARPPPVGLDSFQCDFFSGRAPAHARTLGDALYALAPEGLGHYTTVLTKVPGLILSVAVDGRDMFTITGLPTHRGVPTADVVIPSARPAQFATDEAGAPLMLACAGAEIQLISTYAALCNPAKAATWGEHLAAEAGLRAIFGRETRAKIEEAAASAKPHAAPPALTLDSALNSALNSAPNNEPNSIVGGAQQGRAPQQGRGAQVRPAQTLLRVLRDQYAAGSGRVLIGPAAIALLTSRPVAGAERLQVITTGLLDTDAGEITAMAQRAGAEVAWRIEDPKCPVDMRLRRMTVYLVHAGSAGKRREPILDVYNSGAFDLIPCTTVAAGPHGGPALKIGTPFVLMRFRLIDMWTMQVLLRMGVVNADYARGVLYGMLTAYEAVAAFYEGRLAAAAQDPEAAAAVLIPATCIGRLVEPELALKRAAQARPANDSRDRPRFFPPYFPAARAEATLAAASAHARDDADSADSIDDADDADSIDDTDMA